jgi:transposase InsO family protein
VPSLARLRGYQRPPRGGRGRCRRACERNPLRGRHRCAAGGRPWHTVGLGYLTHLPKGNGFNNVVIVVDHLTRMAHFLPCTKTVTAEETATLFLQGVYRLHGLPRVLVSDRDPKFVSGFWQTLWRRLGTRLNMSSSRHPEIDGMTERVNITFQRLLRCLYCYDGSDWTALLPQVEFAYNA